MREITSHRVDSYPNDLNSALTITVIDEPGQGGASHVYAIDGFDLRKNISAQGVLDYDNAEPGNFWNHIVFQNGPVKEAGGPNGISQEALLAIVIDRLQSFQAGPYPCKENAEALTHCLRALHALHNRTIDRSQRGVEGQNKQ